MIRSVSSLTKHTYTRAVKPLLFRSHPDTVHRRLLAVSSVRQKLAITDVIVKKAWAYRNEMCLGQTVDGVYFSNPVGLAAGFDKNIELLPTMRAIGYGFMTGGSVTFQVCEGNPRPWFHRLPKQKSLVVHVGLANEGVVAILNRIKNYKSKMLAQFPLVVSVAKTNNQENCNDTKAVKDYLGSLRQLKDEPRVSVLEINISCPNAYGGEPFTEAKRLDMLLSAVDELAITKPVWVKMPVNHTWDDFNALLKIIVKHNIQGVTIGNLSKDRGIIPSDDLPPQIKGNLSGLPTQALSDTLIAQTYRAYGDKLTIIGVGGIFNAEDAYRKICNGASLVELITGMIYEGPQLVGTINRKLVKLLQNDGFTTVTEAVGSTHRKRSK